MPAMEDSPDRDWLLIVGAAFEAGIAMLALFLGWWFGVNPLKSFSFELMPVVWGLAGAGVLFLLLVMTERWRLPQFQTIKRMLTDLLGPALNDCRAFELVLFALFIGFCEELMFRGFLQPWIEQSAGYASGLVWSNVLFGLVHAVSLTYGVLAGVAGAYLGWLLDAPGERNLLTPIITHGVYDYLAFLWVIRSYRKERDAENKAL